MVAEYRDSILPGGSKKFINKLAEYQFEMSRFYSLHEEIKQLQRYVQSIVLEETGEKVNIIVSEGTE